MSKLKNLLTRRDFLKYCGVGTIGTAAALALASCGTVTEGNEPSENKGNDSGNEGTTNPNTTNPNEPAVSDAPVHLTVVVTSDPAGLSPYGVNRGGKQCARAACFEPLFWIDEDKNMCSVLGKSYEYKGNGVYDVELFDYIKDSEGNPLKASDIVYSLSQMIEEGHAGSYVGSLDKYEAIGDYTVEFTFSTDDIGSFNTLATYLYCVTQTAWEASSDGMITNEVGTGLYDCTDYVLGSEYVFEARDDYWQTDEQYICPKNRCLVDTLELRIISDTSTIAISLENGEIDYTMNIEEADRDNFVNEDGSAKDGYIVKELVNASLIRLDFNCSDNSPCKDINLRKAIATCIDSAACAFSAQKNYGHVATACVNPNYLDADASLNNTGSYYDYDEAAAKALVEQSSYAGETLKMLVQPNTNTTTSAVLIQAYCRAIGVEIELLEYDSAVYGDYFDKNDGKEYDITLFGINSTNSYIWNAFYELDKNQFSNGLSHNAIYDETLQELYNTAKGAATNSPEAANALLQYVTEQCYEYALYYYNVCYVGLDRIKEVVVGAGNAESIYNAFVVEP